MKSQGEAPSQYNTLLLDVDGTILVAEEERNEQLRGKIENIKKIGVKVALLTARPYAFCTPIINWLDLTSPGIYTSGSYIADNKREIYSADIDLSADKELVRALKSVESKCRLGFPSGRFFYTNQNYFDELTNYLPDISGIRLGGWEDMIVQGCWIRDMTDDLLPQLKPLFRGYDVTLENNDEGVQAVYFKPKGITKVEGLKIWAENCGVSLSKCVLVADGAEDVEPGKIVGVLAAPDNALEQIKSISKFVSNLKYSDGTLDVINQIWP